MKINKTGFGQVDGCPVDIYQFENDHGIIMKVTNYGGIITSLILPDKNGRKEDIVCGFNKLESYFSKEYKKNSPYFGCIIGRYAGRIKDARFFLNGKEYKLAANDGPNHLHGGIKGFDKHVWDAEILEKDNQIGVKLRRFSPDGEEGYPGNLNVSVFYFLNNKNELIIEYFAETDKPTPVSFTNHTYFNLNGFKDKILDHSLQIISDRFLVPDKTNVPTGEVQMIEGTVWDYNELKKIREVFSKESKGFEHYYIFSKPLGSFKKVAEISEETSGRKLEVFTSEPGMLFYTGLYTSDKLGRENGTQFGQFKAFCCETSKYPNGPNIEDSPESILYPGDQYYSKTVFKFGW